MSVTTERAPAAAQAALAKDGRLRPLLPREHGAYGEVVFPMLSALLLGRPNRPSLGLSLAVLALFLAHESVLVVLGQRGRRALVADGSRARLWLVLLGSVTMLSAGWAVTAMPWSALASLPIVAALAGAVLLLVIRGREKTLLGEALAAAALSAVSFPVALSAGAGPRAAILVASVWTFVFTLGVMAVRGFIAAGKAAPDLRLGRSSLALASVALTSAAGLAVVGRLPIAVPAAIAPFCITAIALHLGPPNRRRLRTVGWTLVLGSAFSCFALGFGLR